jgi:hypothetical protein
MRKAEPGSLRWKGKGITLQQLIALTQARPTTRRWYPRGPVPASLRTIPEFNGKV